MRFFCGLRGIAWEFLWITIYRVGVFYGLQYIAWERFGAPINFCELQIFAPFTNYFLDGKKVIKEPVKGEKTRFSLP